MLVAEDHRASPRGGLGGPGAGGTTGSASGQLPDFQPRPARAQVSGRHSRSSSNHFLPAGHPGEAGGGPGTDSGRWDIHGRHEGQVQARLGLPRSLSLPAGVEKAQSM